MLQNMTIHIMFVFDKKRTKILNIPWNHTAWDLTANVNPMSLLVSEVNKMCNSSVTQLSIQLKLCRRKNLSKQKYDLALQSSIVFSGQIERKKLLHLFIKRKILSISNSDSLNF